METLSVAETRVMRLVQAGFINQSIADELVIELGTVKNHVHNILRKLGVRNRHEASRIWVDDGKDYPPIRWRPPPDVQRYYGWICPQCRTVNAPTVLTCQLCK